MDIKVSLSNNKLGNIPSFSLPAKTTCPGSSPWCTQFCYAAKLERIYPNVKNAYSTNFNLVSSQPSVTETELAASIAKSTKVNKVFRLHVSGDFYSEEYIMMWDRLIKNNPNVTFYAYTKSWSVDTLKTSLEHLRKNTNLVLFASTDSTTSATPPKEWRIAYAGETKPLSLSKLVVCPQQQPGSSITCDKCKLCYHTTSTVNIFFKKH